MKRKAFDTWQYMRTVMIVLLGVLLLDATPYVYQGLQGEVRYFRGFWMNLVVVIAILIAGVLSRKTVFARVRMDERAVALHDFLGREIKRLLWSEVTDIVILTIKRVGQPVFICISNRQIAIAKEEMPLELGAFREVWGHENIIAFTVQKRP
ncbi:hypothetical protein LJC20_03965 [Eubacteriales bacterium OttesenSCG-928-M02]|nr:hypothetical protein [Eubacteriales bacterium OttesenSCG-928-M02]